MRMSNNTGIAHKKVPDPAIIPSLAIIAEATLMRAEASKLRRGTKYYANLN